MTAAVVLVAAAPVHAEVLRTKRDTTLRARPGERARAVARLDADQEVEVIKRAGRWLRVKSGKRVGWITRTHVRGNEARKLASKKTRVASWRRDPAQGGMSGERKNLITVRVKNGTQDTFRSPRGTARVAFRAGARDLLTVIGDDRDGAWLLVENRHGQVGWLPTMITTQVAVTRASQARTAMRATAAAAEPIDGDDDADTEVALVSRHARAAMGYRIMSSRFTSNGAAALANYRVTAQAMTATVDGSLPLTAPTSRLVATIEGEYRLSYASPGIHYQDGTGEIDTIGFSMHEARAGGQLGVRVTDSAVVAGHVGYHYGVFMVEALDNGGGLASESLHGVTAGGRVHVTPARSYALRAGVDMLARARRGQSAGLEDGTGSTAGAWWGHLDMDYALTGAVLLSVRYAYERASTAWTGPSPRQPDVTEAARVDQSHLIYLGLGTSF